MNIIYRFSLVILELLLLFSLSPPIVVLANTITVSGGCTLADAIQAANTDAAVGSCAPGSGADTIELSGTIVLNGATIYTADGENGLPSITSNITISGNGSTIERNTSFACDNASTNFRIFHVAAAGDLTLENVTVSNGCLRQNTVNDGGGIYNRGTLTLNNVVISNNLQNWTGVGGGGIFNNNGTLTVNASQIIGNETFFSGGGIYNTGGTVTIIDSTIGIAVNPNDGPNGGGIYNVGGGSVIIDNSTIQYNTSVFAGGGILNSGAGSTVNIINNSIIQENSVSALSGGGIANQSNGVLNIHDSTIRGNTANGAGSSGGGVSNNATLTVINSLFDSNEAASTGGFLNFGSALILNSTFTNNRATVQSGGGVTNFGGGGTMTIANSTFNNNEAVQFGGGLVNGGVLEIISTEFEKNSALAGGGIYNAGQLDGFNLLFFDNVADYGGGIATGFSVSNGNVHASVFDRNEAVLDGGGVFAAGQGSLNIFDSLITTNTAQNGGGLASRDLNTSLVLQRSLVIGNNATFLGGGMYVITDGNASHVINSTFSNNTSAGSGGGISSNAGGSFRMTYTTVTNNFAPAPNYVGGVNAFAGSVMPAGSILVGNANVNCSATNSSISNGDNLFGEFNGITNAPRCAFLVMDPSDQYVASAQLAALADNGGPTQTHATLTGSPAIDGSGEACPAILGGVDQRGVARDSNCDIGAYEVGVIDATLSFSVDTTELVEANSDTAIVTVTLNNPGSPITGEVVVYFRISGSAGELVDYSGINWPGGDLYRLTFSNPPSGISRQAFTITAIPDTVTEGTETVILSMGFTGPARIDAAQADPVRVNIIEVEETADTLPETGFARGIVTALSHQPVERAYAESGMMLNIPKLGVEMEIVGVPLVKGSWDTSWLGKRSGWLEGSAFPTWAGNTILTGHVWDAYNNPGPFAKIKSLKYGDRFTIQAWGQSYIYEVRENKLILPSSVDSAFQHEEYDYVTLLTCELYNPLNGDYILRRMVRAVLVEIK